MRAVRSGPTALAACALALVAGGTAGAGESVDDSSAPSVTMVFGDWGQFAGDDVFNASHDDTVGSNN
ncbi:hypothetical protein ACFW2X_18855 [Streptomyces antibioticus]|uniref:hypothetical protein n=1 Tax=Streptomyces antibioticus TaxID=1890 RepID=UPI0036A806F1